jgi:VIT1/CCC1 family predicted Fe2+/Mn2+ transporter
MRAETYCDDEFTDHLVYKKLAAIEKIESNRQTLLSLSEQEYRHFEFWNAYVESYRPRVNNFFVFMMLVFRRLLGLTFTVKLLERHEDKVIREYKRFAETLTPQERKKLDTIIADEEEHERFFVSQINERVVKYMSFIVLGLADAIVEITGVHAGFLGVTSSTLIAGVAGLVVGVAAAISMASAAYLQSKQEPTRSPIVSAISTGTAYIGTVVILALPYFFTADMAYAFGISVVLAITMTAFFTFYSSVILERKFSRELIEAVGLTLGTAFATYMFGSFLGSLFGIRPS